MECGHLRDTSYFGGPLKHASDGQPYFVQLAGRPINLRAKQNCRVKAAKCWTREVTRCYNTIHCEAGWIPYGNVGFAEHLPIITHRGTNE